MGRDHMGQGRDHMGQGRITWDGKGSHGTGKGSHGTGRITLDREGITWDRGGSHGMGRVKVTLLDMRCCVDGGGGGVDGGGGLPHLYGNYTMLCIARGGGRGGNSQPIMGLVQNGHAFIACIARTKGIPGS